MAQIIEMEGWRNRRTAELEAATPLECPKCQTTCAATNIKPDGSTVYQCLGNGHRPLVWRIDAEGNMRRGSNGHQYY